MNFILDAIDNAANSGQFFPAVLTALTVPDIAGAIESPGSTSQDRYVLWIKKWFLSKYPDYISRHEFDEYVFYSLRCKLLHEGLTNPCAATAASKSAEASRKRMVAFNFGPGVIFHLNTIFDGDGSWTVLKSENFCKEMTSAARDWLDNIQSDETKIRKLESLVNIRMGLKSVVEGIPLFYAEI